MLWYSGASNEYQKRYVFLWKNEGKCQYCWLNFDISTSMVGRTFYVAVLTYWGNWRLSLSF